MAPELMAKEAQYGTEVDVYRFLQMASLFMILSHHDLYLYQSFGLTMWVIASDSYLDPYTELQVRTDLQPLSYHLIDC